MPRAEQAGEWSHFDEKGNLLRKEKFPSIDELAAKKKAEDEAYQKELEEFKKKEQEKEAQQ